MSAALSRRSLLLGGFSAAAALSLSPLSRALAALPSAARSLRFDHLHTGEKLKVTYWENGHYIPGAMAEIDHVLRDFRTGDVKAMDRDLMDLLYVLHNKTGSSQPFGIISAYRSPATNSMLHSRSERSGVAKHSMHLEGKAADIRLSDRTLAQVHNAALTMQKGGVGYYPASNFVHVDTGRLRQW